MAADTMPACPKELTPEIESHGCRPGTSWPDSHGSRCAKGCEWGTGAGQPQDIHPDHTGAKLEFAGHKVGVNEAGNRIWSASFMHYDLAFLDQETCRLETVKNPGVRPPGLSVLAIFELLRSPATLTIAYCC